jgi:hypothetical protein
MIEFNWTNYGALIFPDLPEKIFYSCIPIILPKTKQANGLLVG